jgi:Tfp pilus assembly protein PilN
LLRRIHLPAIQKSYYEEVVLAEVLDTVPFEKEDLDISWQWGPIGKESEVFAAAVPKQTVDAHVRVLNRASFSPSASYPRAVALAAAARVPAAILVHVADDRATLVVVRDWLPGSVLDHHLAERGTPEDLAAQLAEATAKIAGYDHTLTGDERGAELPVILTGTIDDVERVSREFARLSGRALLPFEPDLKYPEHFPPAEYAVNIGLAIADRNRGKPGAKLTEEQVPALNMLSERHLPKPIPFRPIAIFMSLMLFGVVAFNLTPQVEAQVVEATVIGERLDSLEKQARTRRLSVSAARDLEERTEALRTKVTLLDVRLDDLAFELDAVLNQLEAITGLAEAQGVRISSIQLNGEEYILSGSAGSYDGVLAYTESLREAGDGVFTSVRVLRAASSAAAELLAGFEGAGAEANVGFQATAKFNRSDFLLPVEDESAEIVPPTRNSIPR